MTKNYRPGKVIKDAGRNTDSWVGMVAASRIIGILYTEFHGL